MTQNFLNEITEKNRELKNNGRIEGSIITLIAVIIFVLLI